MQKIGKIIAAIFDFLQGIVVFLAILVMVYLFLFSPQEISGRSMEQTFFNGEYVLTNKIIYKLRSPKRGEVVIFKSPRNKEIDYIKRVIGLPGDTVRLSNGVIYVNGLKIEEPYLAPGITTEIESFLAENQDFLVPEGTYFVAGDNRPHSADSRDFGPIPLEDFIGREIVRYWPFTKIWAVETPDYEI